MSRSTLIERNPPRQGTTTGNHLEQSPSSHTSLSDDSAIRIGDTWSDDDEDDARIQEELYFQRAAITNLKRRIQVIMEEDDDCIYHQASVIQFDDRDDSSLYMENDEDMIADAPNYILPSPHSWDNDFGAAKPTGFHRQIAASELQLHPHVVNYYDEDENDCFVPDDNFFCSTENLFSYDCYFDPFIHNHTRQTVGLTPRLKGEKHYHRPIHPHLTVSSLPTTRILPTSTLITPQSHSHSVLDEYFDHETFNEDLSDSSLSSTTNIANNNINDLGRDILNPPSDSRHSWNDSTFRSFSSQKVTMDLAPVPHVHTSEESTRKHARHLIAQTIVQYIHNKKAKKKSSQDIRSTEKETPPPAIMSATTCATSDPSATPNQDSLHMNDPFPKIKTFTSNGSFTKNEQIPNPVFYERPPVTGETPSTVVLQDIMDKNTSSSARIFRFQRALSGRTKSKDRQEKIQEHAQPSPRRSTQVTLHESENRSPLQMDSPKEPVNMREDVPYNVRPSMRRFRLSKTNRRMKSFERSSPNESVMTTQKKAESQISTRRTFGTLILSNRSSRVSKILKSRNYGNIHTFHVKPLAAGLTLYFLRLKAHVSARRHMMIGFDRPAPIIYCSEKDRRFMLMLRLFWWMMNSREDLSWQQEESMTPEKIVPIMSGLLHYQSRNVQAVTSAKTTNENQNESSEFYEELDFLYDDEAGAMIHPSFKVFLVTALIETDLSRDPYIYTHTTSNDNDFEDEDDGLALEVKKLPFLAADLASELARISYTILENGHPSELSAANTIESHNTSKEFKSKNKKVFDIIQKTMKSKLSEHTGAKTSAEVTAENKRAQVVDPSGSFYTSASSVVDSTANSFVSHHSAPSASTIPTRNHKKALVDPEVHYSDDGTDEDCASKKMRIENRFLRFYPCTTDQDLPPSSSSVFNKFPSPMDSQCRNSAFQRVTQTNSLLSLVRNDNMVSIEESKQCFEEAAATMGTCKESFRLDMSMFHCGQESRSSYEACYVQPSPFTCNWTKGQSEHCVSTFAACTSITTEMFPCAQTQMAKEYFDYTEMDDNVETFENDEERSFYIVRSLDHLDKKHSKIVQFTSSFEQLDVDKGLSSYEQPLDLTFKTQLINDDDNHSESSSSSAAWSMEPMLSPMARCHESHAISGDEAPNQSSKDMSTLVSHSFATLAEGAMDSLFERADDAIDSVFRGAFTFLHSIGNHDEKFHRDLTDATDASDPENAFFDLRHLHSDGIAKSSQESFASLSVIQEVQENDLSGSQASSSEVTRQSFEENVLSHCDPLSDEKQSSRHDGRFANDGASILLSTDVDEFSNVLHQQLLLSSTSEASQIYNSVDMDHSIHGEDLNPNHPAIVTGFDPLPVDGPNVALDDNNIEERELFDWILSPSSHEPYASIRSQSNQNVSINVLAAMEMPIVVHNIANGTIVENEPQEIELLVPSFQEPHVQVTCGPANFLVNNQSSVITETNIEKVHDATTEYQEFPDDSTPSTRQTKENDIEELEWRQTVHIVTDTKASTSEDADDEMESDDSEEWIDYTDRTIHSRDSESLDISIDCEPYSPDVMAPMERVIGAMGEDKYIEETSPPWLSDFSEKSMKMADEAIENFEEFELEEKHGLCFVKDKSISRRERTRTTMMKVTMTMTIMTTTNMIPPSHDLD